MTRFTTLHTQFVDAVAHLHAQDVALFLVCMVAFITLTTWSLYKSDKRDGCS